MMEGGPSPRLPAAPQVGRMKFIWRALLISNFALGAYLFVMPKKKQTREESSKAVEQVPPAPVETTSPVVEDPTNLPSPPEPVKVQVRVPKDQQRELFKWMLEEKRNVKPQNRKEKQLINEDKAYFEAVHTKGVYPKYLKSFGLFSGRIYLAHH